MAASVRVGNIGHSVYCAGPPKTTKVKSTLPNEGQIFAGSNFFASIAFPYHSSSEFCAAARFGEGQIFFSVLGYGTILHGVKFFRALSFFTSTEFPGVMFPQYISRGAQLRHKFLKNCTTRNAEFSYLTQEGPQEMYYYVLD